MQYDPPTPMYGICVDDGTVLNCWAIIECANDLEAVNFYRDRLIARKFGSDPQNYSLVMRGFWFPFIKHFVWHRPERVVLRGWDVASCSLDEIANLKTVRPAAALKREADFLLERDLTERRILINGRWKLTEYFSIVRVGRNYEVVCRRCSQFWHIPARQLTARFQNFLLYHGVNCSKSGPLARHSSLALSPPFPEYFDADLVHGWWSLTCRVCCHGGWLVKADASIPTRMRNSLREHVTRHSARDWDAPIGYRGLMPRHSDNDESNQIP